MTTQPRPSQERYEHISLLGRGGAGAVYLVRDRDTGEQLALKRLLRADTQSVMRLKREFRSLADIHHPNLVKLYELGHDHTSLFFTMEYLEGDELEDYLQQDLPPTAANDGDSGPNPARVERVLNAFFQLASAVCALHRAGVLHRDLKPSNVMVAAGRVVVLDFGIAVEVGDSAATVTQDKLARGTPAYMAPEQTQGQHLGQPNDWYAFGVMLYEALSGELPIEGTLLQLLTHKHLLTPRPLDRLVSDLPADVSQLCMQLLSVAPEQRPTGEEVLRVLSSHVRVSQAPATHASTLAEPRTARSGDEAEIAVVGREAELASLWSAFRKVQAGGFGVAHVFGESGSGKSLLVQCFTDEVERQGFLTHDAQPLVLRSRCYERETLPFKALDGAMDSLVNHLMRESDLVVSHSLPRDVPALAQLFPALQRLSATQRLLGQHKPTTGTRQTRAQAEIGLCDLLRRLGSQRPLVLWIDDLQWGDLDSIGIISSWLQPAFLPHLLLVLSYRSEEIASSPCLTALRQRTLDNADLETQIPVRALDETNIRALCKQRFEGAQLPAAAQADAIERIAREAQGSPFLASQLAALAIARPNPSSQQPVGLTLEQLVRSRSSTLTAAARRVLHVLSVAGRPIPLALALQAAGVEREARALLHELQGQQLIRTRSLGQERLLEVYHDRLRETVYAMLSPDERLELDRRLLSALLEAGSSDNDWLHTLALAVDDRAAALRYGLAAAERARETLAFERAAELYARCISLTDDPAADGGVLWEKLALAYARAGHGTKAAATYLHAAQHVPAEQMYLFERAAASHLLCSGRFDEGEALLRKVLARLRADPPRTEAGLYAALAWEQTRLALRGLAYTARDSRDVPFELKYISELFGLLSIETAAYDPLRAAYFQARCLHWALDAGNPEQVARALCAAATIACVSGSERAKRRADEMLAEAEAVSITVDNAVLRTNITSARAICAFLTGQIAASLPLCYEADLLHRTSPVDSEYHHRFSIAAARIGVLLQLSEYRRADSELQVYLQEAQATENISAELHITMAQAWADVNAARAEQAIARLDRQRAQLPQHSYGILHVLYMVSVLRIGCATGEHAWAIRNTAEHWQAFQRSIVRRSDAFSMFVYEAHARLTLCQCARAGSAADRKHAPRLVAKHLKALASSHRGDAHAEVSRIQARLAILRGDRRAAQRLLESSSAGFAQWGARDQAARDRYALGLLSGGESGQSMQREALALLGSLGIVDPVRDLHGYFPELLESEA